MAGNATNRAVAGGEITRSLAVDIEDIDINNRTAVLSFSSEYPVMKWGEPEILSHEPGAVRLERIQAVGTLLYNHSTDINCVLGPILKAWVDAGSKKGKVKVRFDDDADTEKVWQKVLKRTLKGTSVRAAILNVTRLGNGESLGRFKGPATIVTEWEPIEVTITPIPVDPSVGVGRASGFTGGHNYDTAAIAAKSRERTLALLELAGHEHSFRR